MNRHLVSLAVAVALPLGLAACGGEDTVDKADLETEVQRSLSQSVGQEAPKAECPDDLEAKTGASTRCHMEFPENKRLNISVKVKSVDGETAKFDIAADEKLVETPK
jgi:hypothetical protein